LLLLAVEGSSSCAIDDDASKHRCLSDADCLRGRSCSFGYCRDRLSAVGGFAGTDSGGSAGLVATGGDGGRPSGGAGSGGVGPAGGSGAGNASGGTRPAQGGAGEGGAGESGAGQSGAGGTGAGGTGAGGSGAGEGGAGEGGAGAGGDCPAMVRTNEGFCIDSTEVTRDAYRKWLENGPPVLAADGCQSDESFKERCDWGVSYGDLPATCVDWCDAEAYCRAAGKRLCGRIGGGSASYDTEYDDATASQWFAACSSGGKYDYPYGDTYVGNACAEIALVRTTSTLMCHAPSAPYDCVVDLSGNVREWDDSCTDATETASCRLRGGGFFGPNAPSDFACAADASAPRTGATDYAGVGFRCCMDSCP
jgi:sulfatase modifying factor 1